MDQQSRQKERSCEVRWRRRKKRKKRKKRQREEKDAPAGKRPFL